MIVVDGGLKASFSLATTPRCSECATLFLGLLYYTLDLYLIILSVKQAVVKHHFLALPVSCAISEHSTHNANRH